MANVRKIVHPSGSVAWRATVVSLSGKRRSTNHATKKKADAWVKANDGVGASGSVDMTVLDMAKSHNRWFEGIVEAGERDQVTADGYDSHLRIHLKPDAVGDGSGLEALPVTTLSELDTPRCQAFLDRVIARTGSVETARRVRRSLSAWCAHGCRNGWLKANPVASTKIVQKRKRRADSRVELPPKEALGDLLRAAAEGPEPERDTAMVHSLMFGGFRISEALGAADDAVALQKSNSTGKNGAVFQVVETLCSRHTVLGDVKSDDGLRDVRLGPATAGAIRMWRVKRGPAQAFAVNGRRITGRLFPAPAAGRFGLLWAYTDFMRQCWIPLMDRAGLADVVPTCAGLTAKGKRKTRNRKQPAFGPHMLRHVFASIQIANGVTPKRLQKLLGHATLAMTMDLYGHLWTDHEGDAAMAEAAERSITVLT